MKMFTVQETNLSVTQINSQMKIEVNSLTPTQKCSLSTKLNTRSSNTALTNYLAVMIARVQLPPYNLYKVSQNKTLISKMK
jgi:hypothetical protein